MVVVWVEDTSHTAPSSPPRYEVNGATIDSFVITIFDVLQKLPGRYKYRVNSNPPLRELLTRYNTGPSRYGVSGISSIKYPSRKSAFAAVAMPTS
jgi:hypothetical protein